MFEWSELRSRREEQRRDGVKNLNGSETIHEYLLINTHTKWKRTILIKFFLLSARLS